MGERLRRIRISRGLSLYEVAEAIQCHYSTISAYERGTRNPSYPALTKLSQLYEVPIPFLVCDSSDLSRLLPPEMRKLFQVAQERTDIARLALRAAQLGHEAIYHLEGLLSLLLEEKLMEKEESAPEEAESVAP